MKRVRRHSAGITGVGKSYHFCGWRRASKEGKRLAEPAHFPPLARGWHPDLVTEGIAEVPWMVEEFTWVPHALADEQKTTCWEVAWWWAAESHWRVCTSRSPSLPGPLARNLSAGRKVTSGSTGSRKTVPSFLQYSSSTLHWQSHHTVPAGKGEMFVVSSCRIKMAGKEGGFGTQRQ